MADIQFEEEADLPMRASDTASLITRLGKWAYVVIGVCTILSIYFFYQAFHRPVLQDNFEPAEAQFAQ